MDRKDFIKGANSIDSLSEKGTQLTEIFPCRELSITRETSKETSDEGKFDAPPNAWRNNSSLESAKSELAYKINKKKQFFQS